MTPEESIPAVPVPPVSEEEVQYEYVEAPAVEGEVQYEYVEAPVAEGDVQYEYVEAPVAEGDVQYEYVEAPVAEGDVQYEYAEVPVSSTEPATEIPEISASSPQPDELTPAAQEILTALEETQETESSEKEYDFDSLFAPAEKEEPAVSVQPVENAVPEPVVEEAQPVENVPPAEEAQPVESETKSPLSAGNEALQHELETVVTSEPVAAAALAPDEVFSSSELETPDEETTFVEDLSPATVPVQAETPVPEQPADNLSEQTQEELNPPEISDTLQTPAASIDAAAMQETAQMQMQEAQDNAVLEQEIALAEQTSGIEALGVAQSAPEPVVEETPVQSEQTVVPEPAVEALGVAQSAPEPVVEETPVQSEQTVAPEPAVETLGVAQSVLESVSETVSAAPEQTSVQEPAVEDLGTVEPVLTSEIDTENAFIFGDNDGVKSFSAPETDPRAVTLQTTNLSKWLLIINQVSVSPIEAQANQEIELGTDMLCQGQLIGATGDVVPFANVSAVPVPAFTQDAVQALTLFFSATNVISLKDKGGSSIDLGGANGILADTDGNVLFFANITAVNVPEVPVEAPQPAPVQASAVTPAIGIPTPAYAFAPVPVPVENAVIFTADSESAQADGSVAAPHILVKTNDRLYGWYVDFASAGRMSLADVKTYQATHGVLPEANGVLSYKDKQLAFTNMQSIKVFETPAYCGYGIAP